jgi:hypothetical protein
MRAVAAKVVINSLEFKGEVQFASGGAAGSAWALYESPIRPKNHERSSTAVGDDANGPSEICGESFVRLAAGPPAL